MLRTSAACLEACLRLRQRPQSLECARHGQASCQAAADWCMTCSYLKINTIFGVAKAHGLVTAWSDKASGYIVRTLLQPFPPHARSQEVHLLLARGGCLPAASAGLEFFKYSVGCPEPRLSSNHMLRQHQGPCNLLPVVSPCHVSAV